MEKIYIITIEADEDAMPSREDIEDVLLNNFGENVDILDVEEEE